MTSKANSWTEKHRPETYDDIQGNNQDIDEIRKWAENFSPGDPPKLLVGPPGTGKSTTAEVTADHCGYPLNEINTSEARTKDDITNMADSIGSTPVTADHQLILLDEVDSWHHSSSKKPLADALKNPSNPVILTANDEYDVPGSIKKKCDTLEFKLGIRSRRAKIKDIADREDLDLDQQDLAKLAERPDLRSAINDLQTWAGTGHAPDQDHRTWEEGEFSAMDALLSGEDKRWRKAVGYNDETFSMPGDAILWADENLSQEFRGLEAGVGYRMLAKADEWEGRVWTHQEFRYRKFAWALIGLLPEARLTTPYDGYINVSFPSWFRASEPKHDGGTAEAELYQAIKSDRGYQISGSFYEFRQRILPILQDLSEEERRQLALDHGLDGKALEALNLDESDFDDWQGEAEAGDGWEPETQSAADANW